MPTPSPVPDAPAASAPRSARARVREEMTAEILAVAAAHVARDGAAALSLRSIARDLGMAPSALYRYFDGRDALLSALILSAYEDLADAAGGAADRAAASGVTEDVVRWLAVPHAMRAWALDHPHRWGLIFGTPVPGYDAPEATVEPYSRMAAALARPIVAAHEGGRLRPPAQETSASSDLAAAVAPVAEALLPELPPGVTVLLLGAFTALIGSISLEVFGHWRNTVLEPELLFRATLVQAAETLGLTERAGARP